MDDHKLLKMYRCYLPYSVKTDKGLLWSLSADGIAITKTEDGELIENKLRDIKLHLNPIERLIEEVDEPFLYKTTPLIKLALSCENNTIWDPKMKGVHTDSGKYFSAIKYRDNKNQYKLLIFSSEQGFSLQSTSKEDAVKDREIMVIEYIPAMYEQLYKLHINIFDLDGLTKDKYIIKENINKERWESQVGRDL